MKALHQVSRDYTGLVGNGLFTPHRISFAIGAEAANVILVTCQLLDARGEPIKVANVPILFWLGVDTAGDYTFGTAASGFTIQTYGQRIAILTSSLAMMGVTNLNGICEVRVNISGASARRLCAMLPGGTIFQSGSVTFV